MKRSLNFFFRSAIIAMFAAGTFINLSGFANADLVHRYTFNGGNANDDIGGAHGTVMGGAAPTFGGGLATFNGGGAGNSYIDLPDGIASAAANGGTSGQITTEGWVTMNGLENWAVIFSFGNSGPGIEDNNGSDGDYWQLIPQHGAGGATAGQIRSTTHIGDGNIEIGADGGLLTVGTTFHYANVLDLATASNTLYINGNFAAFATMTAGFDPGSYDAGQGLSDTQNWLGRSQWGDPSLNATMDEFRIYNTALDANQVAASFAAGPTAIPEPTSLLIFGLGTLGLVARRRRI